MATGNMPASMMKPMPSRITANMISVKVKPARRGVGQLDSEVGLGVSFMVFKSSLCLDQGAGVAVERERKGVGAEPGFFVVGGRPLGGDGDVVDLGVLVGVAQAKERGPVEEHEAELGEDRPAGAGRKVLAVTADRLAELGVLVNRVLLGDDLSARVEEDQADAEVAVVVRRAGEGVGAAEELHADADGELLGIGVGEDLKPGE